MSKYAVEYSIVVTALIDAESENQAQEIAENVDLRKLLAGEKIYAVEEDQYSPALESVMEDKDE